MKNHKFVNTSFFYSSINQIRFIGIWVLVFIFNQIKSQDVITMKDGSEVTVKVVEVSQYEIKYKTIDTTYGGLHSIYIVDVFSVKYSNGSKEIFNKQSKLPTSTGAIKRALNDTDSFVARNTVKFGGPRFGFTFISPGTFTDWLAEKGKNPTLTQFGWQFETRLFRTSDGTSGIIEFIPLVAGMEQGLFLPSANFLIGLRGGEKNAFEFAIGPSLSISGLAMVFAAGTNFRSGNINFPINLAFVPSVSNRINSYNSATGLQDKVTVHTGYRITLTVGFNVRKK